MNATERVYRFVVRAYPRSYRSAHGDELLATVLQVAGSPPRLSLRELGGLLRGAVRQRFREPARIGRRRTLQQGMWLAALLLLGESAGEGVGNAVLALKGYLDWSWPMSASAAVAFAALAAALRGRLWLAAVLALGPAVMWLVAPEALVDYPPAWEQWAVVVMISPPLLLLIPLAAGGLGRSALRASWGWLAVPVVLAVLGRLSIISEAGLSGLSVVLLALPYVLLLVSAVLDARVALACAVLVWIETVRSGVSLHETYGELYPFAEILLAGAVLGLVLLLRAAFPMRRRIAV